VNHAAGVHVTILIDLIADLRVAHAHCKSRDDANIDAAKTIGSGRAALKPARFVGLHACILQDD